MKKSMLAGLGVFLACLLVDQISKSIGLELSSLKFNHGIIFGIGADSSPFLRILTLSSVFGFLFFLYLFFLYTLPLQLFKLKMGLSFLMGGVFGNVVDRAFRGKSIDFIPFELMGYSITFNLADVFQWIGAGLIVYNVIVHEQIIWFPDNKRQRYLINPHEQLKFSIKLSALTLCLSLLMGIFSIAFMRVAFLNISSEAITLYSLSFISLAALFGLIVFIVGLVISHRSAGPLYAFENYVEELLEGKRDSLTLREGDNYKHLEKIANKLLKHFKDFD